MANQYSLLQGNSRKRRQEEVSPVPSSYSLNVPLVPMYPPNRPAILSPLLTFTSLLNNDRTAEIVEQSDEIASIIIENAEELQKKLNDKWMKNFNTIERAAEERVWKKIKEFEVEIETMKKKLAKAEERVEYLTFEKNVWEAKSRDLEDELANMRASIFKTSWARPHKKKEQEEEEDEDEDEEEEEVEAAAAEEVVESSSDSSSSSRVKKLMCIVCGENVKGSMMWPCLHVSVCKNCESMMKVCPVCHCAAPLP